MLGVFLVLPSLAFSQQIPKDQCTLLSPADLEPILGKGVTSKTIGDEQCNYESPHGEYEIAMRRQNGAAELKDWTGMTMVKPVAPVPGIGDEAFKSKNENVVAFRKGNVAMRVAAAGVMKTAPMTYQQGVVEVAKKLAAKLK